MKVLCLIRYRTWETSRQKYVEADDAIMIEVSSASEILWAYSHALRRYLAHQKRHRLVCDIPYEEDVQLVGYLPEGGGQTFSEGM